MWDVLKVYDVCERLLNGIKDFHKDAKACIKVNGEMSEFLNTRECEVEHKKRGDCKRPVNDLHEAVPCPPPLE